jgi:hypothetical protein
VDESDQVDREKLGPPLATVVVEDCRVTFRRQARTEDVWCVTTGPLGTFAVRLIDNEVLRRVIRGRPSRDASRDASSRVRTLRWARVRIDDDFLIAVRARGNVFEFAYLFSDGASFGGASGGLPTGRRRSPLDLLVAWFSGRRGSSVQVFRHSEGDR